MFLPVAREEPGFEAFQEFGDLLRPPLVLALVVLDRVLGAVDSVRRSPGGGADRASLVGLTVLNQR